MKTLAFACCVSFLFVVLSVLGAEMPSGADILRRIPQLKSFFEAKEKQARAEAKALALDVPEEVWTFFKAAREGNWDEASTLWKGLSSRNRQHESSTRPKICQSAAWPCALEVILAVEQFSDGNAKFTEAAGQGIVDSIARGAIYFGGTDPGRGLPTALSKSHAEADPFFTLTQNALADNTYMEYLRRMYGGKITIPDTNATQQAFQDYLSDAQRRLDHDKKFPNQARQIKPGEDVRLVDNRVQVGGQVAVMAINGLISKFIFDQNPTREFYVEESFPLDWMYPLLSPHGFIMKINRDPLESLPAESITKDHEFWSAQCKKLLGNPLTPETSVNDLCDFAGKIYADKDLTGFIGDPDYAKDDHAQKMYSKLRSSIAGMYAWRLNHSTKDREALSAEADFAFKQAFLLCPYSPEAIFRYINFLIGASPRRLEDALVIANTAVKVDPSNRQVRQLKLELERMKKGGPARGAKKPR